MFKFYIISALTNIIRNRIFSAINILGFAFSISICLAITIFLVHEYSFDKYHKNAKQIYRLINSKSNSSQIDYRVATILKEKYPEIKNTCLLQTIPYPVHYQASGEGFYVTNTISCDNSFFDIFSVRIIKKISESPFSDENSIIINESTAKLLFGNDEPIGKEIKGFDTQLIVSAVIEDFPDNSSILGNILVNAENENFRFSMSCSDSNDKSTYRWPFCIYLLVKENTQLESLISKINNNGALRPYEEKIDFQSLNEQYLHDKSNNSYVLSGSPTLLNMLKIIALIILGIALINYINLISSQLNKRGREIGIKKTIGAFQKNIRGQLIVEAFVIIFIAFVLALIFLQAIQPIYKYLFYPGFSISVLLKPATMLYLLITIVFLGILSGYVSSTLFLKASPLKILTNRALSISGKRKSMQNVLITFQFIISIVMIISVIIIQKQIKYAKHKDLGFNKEQLLSIEIPKLEKSEINRVNLLIDRLRHYPDIASISKSFGIPGAVRVGMGSGVDDIKESLSIIVGDSLFLETFKIKVIKGRSLEKGDFGQVCLFNEEAYKLFNWTNLDHKKYNNGGGFEVIGVFENIHYNSLHTKVGPMAILFKDFGNDSHINIRINPNNIGHTIDAVKRAWYDVFPDYALKYQFYDEWFNTMYQKEEKLAATVKLFAILAIVISSLGIFGLSIFTTAGRIKEIGIRKVNGAKTFQILTLLHMDLLKWVIIAFVVACPIAWSAMHRWLENFAYKTELGWWIFALAGLLAFAVALLTVSWQSWKAATRNPVEALRYE